MGSLVRTVPPTTEPIIVQDVIAQGRIAGDTTELQLILDYAIAARDWAEDYAERSFMPQTWQQQYDWRWPREMRLRRGPVTAVSSITYVDTAGVSQTLSTSLYQVDLNSDPARIREAYQQVWPVIREQYAAVTVTYTAGYGTAPSDVPRPIRNAIIMLAAYWFDQRMPVMDRTASEVPWGIKALLDPYRQMWYAAA